MAPLQVFDSCLCLWGFARPRRRLQAFAPENNGITQTPQMAFGCGHHLSLLYPSSSGPATAQHIVSPINLTRTLDHNADVRNICVESFLFGVLQKVIQ